MHEDIIIKLRLLIYNLTTQKQKKTHLDRYKAPPMMWFPRVRWMREVLGLVLFKSKISETEGTKLANK
jgi:hypothetical protein